MPEVHVTMQTLARFEVGDYAISEDTDGDIKVSDGNISFYLTNSCEKDEFTALIRAYLAHIDSEEAANA